MASGAILQNTGPNSNYFWTTPNCGLISNKVGGFSAKVPGSTLLTSLTSHVALRGWLGLWAVLWTGDAVRGPPVHGGPGWAAGCARGSAASVCGGAMADIGKVAAVALQGTTALAKGTGWTRAGQGARCAS